jgi:hypothetical protein
MLTSRFFALALLCPALLLVGAFFPAFVPIALVYGIGLLILVGLDRRGAGNAKQFTITREHDDKLSLGVMNKITVHITSRANSSLDVTMRDEPPSLCTAENFTQTGTLIPHQPALDRTAAAVHAPSRVSTYSQCQSLSKPARDQEVRFARAP